MASAASQRIQYFVRSISEDIKLYQQLLTLLQQQKALYLKFDGEALNTNVQQQTPILNKLSRSSNERSQCMRELGLPCNDSSVTRIFNALPGQDWCASEKTVDVIGDTHQAVPTIQPEQWPKLCCVP